MQSITVAGNFAGLKRLFRAWSKLLLPDGVSKEQHTELSFDDLPSLPRRTLKLPWETDGFSITTLSIAVLLCSGWYMSGRLSERTMLRGSGFGRFFGLSGNFASK